MQGMSRKPSFLRIAAVTEVLACVLVLALISGQAAGQEDPFGGVPDLSGRAAAGKNPLDQLILFNVEIVPPRARAGEVVRLAIKGLPREGYHTYPLTMRADDPLQDKSQLCKLTYRENPDLKPLWPITESEPEFEEIAGLGTVLEHRKAFTWSQDLLIMPEAAPGRKTLAMRVHAQICKETCVWQDFDLEAEVEVLPGPSIPLGPELKQRLNAPPPAIKVVPRPTNSGGGKPAIPDGSQGTDQASDTDVLSPNASRHSLIGFLLLSVSSAFLMLLTPCVFPMIPITVSFFLKQSERSDHRPLVSASVYSLTIILVLAAAVLVLGQLIVGLANDAWLNLGLGALLAFFAFSLFGMYEIELPSGLARFTAAHESKGGYVGAIFMALTFTITSFTCTGPFLGPLLAGLSQFQFSFAERALAALCYAATFAAPFFVLALFPSLLKKLPKGGGWLNAVKVIMGFLELAAALKFLANTDLAWNPGNPRIFNYETVLCAWIALSVACGMYLLGLFRLPHDSPVEALSAARMVLGTIFFGLALYMAPALWRVTPLGSLGQGLVAFLPLDTRITQQQSSANGVAELTWLRDYETAWRQANQDGKLIFIDFTGQNCTNCRYNEKNVFPIPGVHEELAKYVRVQLYTDFVPDASLSASESRQQAQRNSDWQNETFGDIANPLYAVIKPDRDKPFEVGQGGKQKLKGTVLGIRKGLIGRTMVADFERFLSRPIQLQVQANSQRNLGEKPSTANGTQDPRQAAVP
jgi:thiol:disulfide interchange protein DsbD